MTERRPKVLYVDDQEGNLVVFRASLKKYVDIQTASSGEEALALLAKEEFPIVLSDQKMDSMAGTELLATVRRLYPDTIRMLMTAFTNFDDVVSAINDGQVSRFISKPWERQELLAALTDANDLYWTTKENRSLSEQLMHRERLAAIGQVTSGLVHELGNIGAVLVIAEDMAEMWRNGEDLSREFEVLKSGIDKFQMLVESLRIYSKGGGPIHANKRDADLNKMISQTIVLLPLFPTVKELKKLAWTPLAEPLLAKVDARKLEQVLINLVKNAAESCANGKGVVEVTLRPDGTHAVIEVRDNGPGIPPEAAAKIWQGFYSTKGERGTGLGLSMCRKILEAHGGSIAFANNEGTAGCTFTLRVPLA